MQIRQQGKDEEGAGQSAIVVGTTGDEGTGDEGCPNE